MKHIIVFSISALIFSSCIKIDFSISAGCEPTTTKDSLSAEPTSAPNQKTISINK